MQIITLQHLAFMLIPVLLVFALMSVWKISLHNPAYAFLRMLVQLLGIGYFLNYLFDHDSAPVTLAILAVMIFFSSWIALGTVKEKRRKWLPLTIIAIACGGGLTLFFINVAVLELHPWYQARFMIPIAGMTFASSMNSISLAGDRFDAEISKGATFMLARNHAFNTAMIPTINGLFAVGIVSLPGMMTGQILSGTSPFVAARYQIMVMAMIFSASGLSTGCFLTFLQIRHRH